MEKDTWITIEEAADLKGVSWMSIRRAISNGKIAAGVGLKPKPYMDVMLVLRSDVEKWERSPRGMPRRPREEETNDAD